MNSISALFSRASRGLAVVALLALAGPGVGWGATYVVDGGNAQASDDGPGNQANPFRTIGRATGKLQPGDTVWIKAGAYRETVRLEANGTAEQPITLAAAPGDEGKAVITGSDLVTDWQRPTEAMWTTPWHHTLDSHYPADWITTFAMADYGPYAKRCEMVFVDGQPLQQVLATGLLRQGTFVVDEPRHLLRMAPAPGQEVKQVEVAVRQEGLKIHGRFLHVRGLSVIHVANTYEAAAMDVAGDDNVVENCRIEWNNLDGLRLGGHRLRATGNVASHNGDCGIHASIDDSRLENNTTSDNSWRMGPGWHEGGIKVVGIQPANNVIVGHVAKNNRGAGIWFDSCGPNNRVERCWLEGNLIAGLEFEACLGGNQVAVNNVICKTRPIADAMHPKGDGAGILIYESGGVKIQNNTIVGNARSGIALVGGQRENGAYCANLEIYNNIIADNGTAGLTYWFWGKATKPETLASHRSDYNLWYQPQGKLAILLTSQPADLPQLQTATGQEAHSLSGEPKFTAADKGDYRLLPDSPAIARGLRIEDVSDDYTGQARSAQGGPDLGAYEHR